MKQTVSCSFKFEGWQFMKKAYTCVVKEQNFDNSDREFSGNHLSAYNDKDITAVFLINCSMTRVPQGLTKSFPNMRQLLILISNLACVERDDFKEYVNLTQLYLTKVEIAYLPRDVFHELKKLKFLSLFSIKFHLIEPDFLDDLKCLELVEIYDCGVLKNMLYSVFMSRPGNVTLSDIKSELSETYVKSPWKNFFIKEEEKKNFNQILPQILIDDKCLLNDVSGFTICIVMNFIFNQQLPTSDDINFIHLLSISEKFNVRQLSEFAAEKLMDRIDETNIYEIYSLSEEYNHKKLRMKSFQELRRISENKEKMENTIKLMQKRAKMMKELENKFEQRYNARFDQNIG